LTGFGRLCYFEFTPVGETASPTQTASFVQFQPKPVITGFNTDIPYKGITYHVQTEDKGLDSPLLLSLVYVGGAIIASKRTPYEDLIASGFDEQVLTERLQRQHKLICAAIKAGRVEELKRMGVPQGSAPPQAKPGPGKTAVTSEGTKGEGTKGEGIRGENSKGGGQRKKKSEATQPRIQGDPFVEAVGVAEGVESEKTESDFVFITTMAEEVSHLEIFKPHPKPTLDALAETATHGQDVPTQVQDMLPQSGPETILSQPATGAFVQETAEDAAGEIYLSLLDDEGDFRAGQLATVRIRVGRGAYGQMPVKEATVTVKILGTSFRPIILTTVTDESGLAVVRALLPRFTSGRAAIIIRAVSGEDAAEVRRIIQQS
jgi:hypothetical protein